MDAASSIVLSNFMLQVLTLSGWMRFSSILSSSPEPSASSSSATVRATPILPNRLPMARGASDSMTRPKSMVWRQSSES